MVVVGFLVWFVGSWCIGSVCVVVVLLFWFVYCCCVWECWCSLLGSGSCFC